MKKILLSLILLPTLCWGQTIKNDLNTEKIISEFNSYLLQYGEDKQKHFLASYGLVYASGNQDLYLLGPIIDGQILALKRGIEKECDDIGISFVERNEIYKELEIIRESNKRLWFLIKKNKLNSGDLIADYTGVCVAGALLSSRQFLLLDETE